MITKINNFRGDVSDISAKTVYCKGKDHSAYIGKCIVLSVDRRTLTLGLVSKYMYRLHIQRLLYIK